MKLLAASAAVVLFYSGAGMAQQTPGDTPPATEPPSLTLVTGNEARHARDADARHCLAQKSNLAIIRCAERYRYFPVAFPVSAQGRAP